MTRILYEFILWMHPPAFRRRFCDEMLSIFDEGAAGHSAFGLLLDGLISLARQWLWRTDSWKILTAICGGFLQVGWFIYPRRVHQGWTEDHQTLTPYMQELIVITLAIICGLFVMIMLLATWTVRFQRRPANARFPEHQRKRAAFVSACRTRYIEPRSY